MKKLVIEQKKNSGEIDWNKPQWVINAERTRVILTTGFHDGSTFAGTCMPCDSEPYGKYTNSWGKEFFAPLTEDIQFTISNGD